MIVDLRTYTLSPGMTRDFLQKYEAQGLPLHRKHIGMPIGYFYSEVGTQNQVVHLWGYESMAEREAKRAKMEADPDWWAYRDRMTSYGHIVHQKNKILRSAPFSPL